MNITANIEANLQRLQERIAAAAARAGRKPEEITLIAVSKTFGADAIQAAYSLGLRHFGENRVQEWDSKRTDCLGLDAHWHLIGHLQSNKARRAVQIFDTVDSVDSISLAQKLNAAMEPLFSEERARGASRVANGTTKNSVVNDSDKLLPKLDVLIEVQLAPEQSKSGVPEVELPALVDAILPLGLLKLRGLMAIPPFLERPEDVRKYFRKLRELRDAMQHRLAGTAYGGRSGVLFPELSMGMSHDCEVAIEEGATQIRVGTALFGTRQGFVHTSPR